MFKIRKLLVWRELDLKPLSNGLDSNKSDEIVPVRGAGHLNNRRPDQTEFGLS